MDKYFIYLHCSAPERHLCKYPLKSLDEKETFKCCECNADVIYDPDDGNDGGGVVPAGVDPLIE
jgi:hypothetical protein